MNRKEIAQRKHEVMKRAAQRYIERRARIAETAQKLARGGPEAAASESSKRNFRAREALKLKPTREEKRIGGTFDWEDRAPSAIARSAGAPVARIVELRAKTIGAGFATGFVVAPGLLVTNWHVFASASDTRNAGAHFNYELGDDGMLRPGVVFEIDAQSFFFSDEALDIAIVGISPTAVQGQGALSSFGSVRLIPTLGKILVGHAVNIIQHPDGRHKHWAMQKNTVTVEPKSDDLFLMYTTDTLEGSSGSPAFNYDWELVAVHHGGVPRVVGTKVLKIDGQEWKPGMPETDIDWIANEGARVSKVHSRLTEARLPSERMQKLLGMLLVQSKDVIKNEGSTVMSVSNTNGSVVPKDGHGMNITINGTANFYVNGENGNGRIVTTSTSTDGATTDTTRLQVAVEKKLRYDPKYSKRPGYKRDFLDGYSVPPPTAPEDEVLSDANGPIVLKYHHYSVAMHDDRRLAMWTATNADYDASKRRFTRDELGGEAWKPDPRITIEQQIEDMEFYEPARKFDRGHLARRDDVCWGETADEEEFANADSYHWTNCTPQHEGFNRDKFGYHGIWGQLENHITSQAKFVEKKLIIFAGPILSKNDPKRDFGSGIDVKIPIKFWKVIVAGEVVNNKKRLRAYGFILDQTEAIEEYGWEGRFKAGKFSEQQVSLRHITDTSRVELAEKLHKGDPLAGSPTESKGRRLESLESVKLD